jgi:nicotinate-nucleotide adenylyltransferase
MTKKVGVFGGTFNPIHYGHLRAAEEVSEILQLDQVIFVPSANPPHKHTLEIPAAEKRMQMIELAVQNHPRFLSSDIEIRRGGRSYSVDTLRQFRRQLPKSRLLYFILGLDAFLEIRSWRDYREIFLLANLAVISRPGCQVTSYRETFPVEIRREFCYDFPHRIYVHTSGSSVHFLRIPGLEISASEIREKLARKRSIRYLTTDSVIRFIERAKLYREG